MTTEDSQKKREQQRIWRKQNPDKIKAYSQTYYAKHKHKLVGKPQTEKRKQYMAQYNAKDHKQRYVGEFKAAKQVYNRERRYTDREKVKSSELKCHYGITLNDYSRMLEAQQGVCAICRKPETAKLGSVVRSLAVDHDHDTDEVRGLLCGACNAALGLLKEDPSILQSMIDYISKYKNAEVA